MNENEYVEKILEDLPGLTREDKYNKLKYLLELEKKISAIDFCITTLRYIIDK